MGRGGGIVWGLLKVLNSEHNVGITFIYKQIQNPEPDRDRVSSINASSLVLPVSTCRQVYPRRDQDIL